MRKVIMFLLMLLFGVSVMEAQSDTSGELRKWPGSSHYPVERDYPAMTARIRALSGPRVKVGELGFVQYDKVKYPIYSLVYSASEKPKVKVLLISGAHGDEPAGPEAVLSFFKSLSARDVSVESVPLINPWGWTHSVRYNGNGIDINRDFILFQSAEAGLVRGFTQNKTYDLVIDFHEASQSGAFIYSYADGDEAPAGNLMGALKAAGFAVAGVSGKNTFHWGITDGMVTIPAHPPSDRPMFRNRSTIARYFNGAPGTLSYTFETSIYKKLADRIACDLFAVKFLMAQAAGGG